MFIGIRDYLQIGGWGEMSKQREDLHSAAVPLRDWFAGQALSGLIARGVPDPLAIRKAYEIAAMMLEARR